MSAQTLPPFGLDPGRTWTFVSETPSDTEHLIRPLQARYTQSGRGRFAQRMHGVLLDRVLVVSDWLNTPVHFSGHVLADSLAFQCFRSRAPVRKSHSRLPDECLQEHLVMWSASEELGLASQAEVEVLSLFVEETYWNQVAETLGIPVPKHGSRLVAFRFSDTDLLRLRRRWHWVLEAAAIYPACFQRPAIRRVAEMGLVCAIFELFGRAHQQRIEESAGISRRREAVARVEAHIRDHYSEPLTLPDLCELSGLKARALQYAFQEKHALTPMAFLKIVRLNRARERLRDGDPRTTSVTSVALSVGFWHLSQFASDYQALFHELPSETLRMGKRTASRDRARELSGAAAAIRNGPDVARSGDAEA